MAEDQHNGDTLSPTRESVIRVPAELGGFRLVRELGRGGMGVVYEAVDQTLNRRVALKTLLPDQTDETFRQRFLREGQAVGGLRHDHVVTIHQVGQDGDVPFLVMEFLEGESLDNRLTRQPWLSVPEAVRIAREVAEGLAAAHEKGVIHRDIKPGNIWLQSPTGRVKLLDFGLAQPAEVQPLTSPGAVAGTPGYMAPEQIYGGQLDSRTDLYALGCVLYQMLWGMLPYQKQGDTIELLNAVVNQDAPHLSSVAARFPAPLGELLRRLLARNPGDRPSSAAEVADQLRQIESGLAAPPRLSASTIARLREPVDRWSKLGIWAGGGIILLAAVIGLASQYNRFVAPSSTDPPAPEGEKEPIRVGVLHSTTGTFAHSERGMIDALALAAEEINASGGVLGRPIKLIHADGHSDEMVFRREAERLIKEEQVEIIFGCWSSSSRKQVADVCDQYKRLLVYSCAYEGLEEHPWVIYAGGAPNQQFGPVVIWAYGRLQKRKFFLVGSDFVYSRVSNQILKDDIKEIGGSVVGEEYVPLQGTSFGAIVEKIKASKADVIFNTVDGTSNTSFFHAVWEAGVRSEEVPTFWLSGGEEEMSALPLSEIVGDYAAAPYFQTLESPTNQGFLKRLQARYPTRNRVSDSTEMSYCAVYLWKKAVEQAGSTDSAKVRDAFRGQWFDGPEGRITIDKDNLHAWRTARLAQMKPDTHFEVVFTNPRPEKPEPFPRSRTREQWLSYLDSLYKGWGNRWEAPRLPFGKGKGP